jgi:hypothetical protein
MTAVSTCPTAWATTSLAATFTAAGRRGTTSLPRGATGTATSTSGLRAKGTARPSRPTGRRRRTIRLPRFRHGDPSTSLETTTTELVAHLQKDWAADVAAYDKVHDVILHMADMLTDGIANQFPGKVK